MFKNRSLQVKVVKDEEKETKFDFDQFKDHFIDPMTKSVAIGIATYIAADTVRRVVIHVIATKIS